MRSRQLILLGPLLLALLSVGFYAGGRAQRADRDLRLVGWAPVAREGSVVRVLVWNIAHGRGPELGNWSEGAAAKEARVREIARFIAAQSADVVVLNEVDFCSTWSGCENQAEAIARIAGYGTRLEQRNFDVQLPGLAWKFGNGLLSRLPLSDCRRLPLPPRSQLEDLLVGSKQGATCRLTKGSLDLRLATVHLDPRDERTRVRAAEQIILQARAPGPPLVAAGDFNSALASTPHASFTASGENATQHLIDSGSFTAPRPPRSAADLTFPSTQPSVAIDWVFAPPDLEFTRFDVLESKLSDHRPLLVEIRARARESAPSPTAPERPGS